MANAFYRSFAGTPRSGDGCRLKGTSFGGTTHGDTARGGGWFAPGNPLI